MHRAQSTFGSVLDELVEAMPDAIVIVDAGGRIVLVNRNTEVLSGYSREELQGMQVEQLVPEALRAQHLRHRAGFQRAPTVRAMGRHLDIRFRRRDGSEFPADIALSPMATARGPLVVASVRDITERRRAEDELLRAEERFRLVVESIREYAIFMLDPEGNVSSWSPAAARILGYEADEIVGRHFSVLYPRADVESGRPARELAAAAAGRYEEEGWRVRKDGSRFWASVATTAIQDRSGRPVGFARVTRDVTERKRQDDRIRAVLDVAQATLEGTGEEELLHLVAERARALAVADLGLVALADAEEESLVVAAADGRGAAEMRGTRLPLAPAALMSDQPLVLDEASWAGRPSSIVRLRSGQRMLGALAVAHDPGGQSFDEADLMLLEHYAARAAVAIDYTRARGELQRLAVLEDRERIGRDLHDGAIQALYAVGMGLEALAARAADAVLRDRLEGSVTQIDDVIRELRNYIFGLRPGLAADRHLVRALEELARQLEEKRGIACAVEIDERLAARLAGRAADIIQVAREALSNVGRHARAATCSLSLRSEPGGAVLEIEDDGSGFTVGETTTGMGLGNLRDRATAMGATLEVASVPGEGTIVSLRIPI